MIEIRVALRDDADQIAAAHIEGWRVGYRDLLPPEFLQSEEFAQVRLDRWRLWTWPSPGSEMYVAVVDGRVVGFGHAGPERRDDRLDDEATSRGEVFGFYLHPDAWGSGAADQLMATCADFLIGLGFTEAVLWVLRDNPRARGFYERAGWSFNGCEAMFGGPQVMGTMPGELAEVQYGIRFR